ncbi:MAG: NADP-dependent oxidoreductase [Candidatus Promineifilaceae bacterium]|nr:NADP-dependent oxidoreductase [Candidatus Promineifilaceae bacterium]
MKAAIFDSFGDTGVVRIADIPRPQISEGELLVRVHAAAVNPKDTFIRKGYLKRYTGETFPMLPGFDYAGEIAAVGSEINDFQVGDLVYGMLDGWQGATCAEFLAIYPDQASTKPETLSFINAAAVPLVSSTALQAFRDEAGLQEGHEVCINGASGGVGSVAVQIAKIMGARVTAVSRAENHEFLHGLGADVCLDYREVDITRSERLFDVFFDVFGNHRFEAIEPILTKEGIWVSTVLQSHVFESVAATQTSRGKKAKLVIVKSSREDLDLIRSWIDAGRLKPIVHSVFPLDQIQVAHAQQETKHTRGKLVISIP